MQSLALLLWLLPRRMRSAWGLLAVTAFGVLAAVTIMALGAMYSQALAEAGLRHALAVTAPTVINTQIVVRNRPLGPADYAALRADIEDIIDQDVGYLLRDRRRYAKMLPTLPFTQVGAPYGISDVPLGRPFFVTGFTENARLTAGRWPSDTVTQDGNGRPRVEGVLGVDTARLLGWGVGKEAWLVVFPGATPETAQYISVDIVGITEPIDPRAEYWMGGCGLLPHFRLGRPPGSPHICYRNGVLQRHRRALPDAGGRLRLVPVYRPGHHHRGERFRTPATILTALETDINSQFPRSYILTGLENSRNTGLLATYQRELTLARAPLFLFISLVVVVILYFLALAVSLLAGARAAESSMLRSRGASVGQGRRPAGPGRGVNRRSRYHGGAAAGLGNWQFAAGGYHQSGGPRRRRCNAPGRVPCPGRCTPWGRRAAC